MDGSPARVTLKAFAWSPLYDWGEAVEFDAPVAETLSPTTKPDYLYDPDGPSAKKAPDGLDEFGWRKVGPRFVTERRRLTILHDVSVLRRSLGRDRWHVVLDNGIVASDSYHDGEWLGAHIGETVRLGLQDGPTLTANIMDDAPIDAKVRAPAVLISHFWAENYAHTLLETASRFWAYEECPEMAAFPVVWETNRPWQKEIAEWLCPGKAKPLPANHVRFETLYVPSFYSQIGASQASVQWLRGRFGAPDQPGKRRIYVTRADATERRVVNENDVLEILAPMGFETVMLTGMSVAEQRDLFRDAEIVVMPHGAGCANMIFAGAGTKIVEFVPRSYQHHMFQHIAKWSGHWYGRVICLDGANKDMTVDLKVLRTALNAACA